MAMNALSLLLAFSAISAIYGMGFIVQKQQDCAEGTPVCPKGFKLFKRKNDRAWCVKFVVGNLTWWEAEKKCRCDLKSTLSGIESISEMRWVEGEAKAAFDKAGVSNGGIWVGSYRRECCNGPQKGWDAKLCVNEKIFQFTDRNTCGTYLYQNWEDAAPTNDLQNGTSVDNCGQLLFSTEEEGTNAELSSKLSNKDCLEVKSPKGDIYSTQAFICGKEATYENGVNGGYDGGYDGGYGGQNVILVGAGKPHPQDE